MTENVSLIKHHYKRTIVILIALMLVFAAIFMLAFAGLQRKQALLGIGMPPEFENWVIMILSLGSIIRIVYELYSLKH